MQEIHENFKVDDLIVHLYLYLLNVACMLLYVHVAGSILCIMANAF